MGKDTAMMLFYEVIMMGMLERSSLWRCKLETVGASRDSGSFLLGCDSHLMSVAFIHW